MRNTPTSAPTNEVTIELAPMRLGPARDAGEQREERETYVADVTRALLVAGCDDNDDLPTPPSDATTTMAVLTLAGDASEFADPFPVNDGAFSAPRPPPAHARRAGAPAGLAAVPARDPLDDAVAATSGR